MCEIDGSSNFHLNIILLFIVIRIVYLEIIKMVRLSYILCIAFYSATSSNKKASTNVIRKQLTSSLFWIGSNIQFHDGDCDGDLIKITANTWITRNSRFFLIMNIHCSACRNQYTDTNSKWSSAKSKFKYIYVFIECSE